MPKNTFCKPLAEIQLSCARLRTQVIDGPNGSRRYYNCSTMTDKGVMTFPILLGDRKQNRCRCALSYKATGTHAHGTVHQSEQAAARSPT